MTPSIRNRLIYTLTGITAAAWLITAIVIYFDTRHEINELLDAQLSQAARTMMVLTRHEAIEQHIYGGSAIEQTLFHQLWPEPGHPYETKLTFQVWVAEGNLVLHSQNAPDEPLSPVDNGFSNVRIDGRHWRVFATQDTHQGITVYIAENDEIREELIVKISSRILTPVAIMLPLLALLIWAGVGHALKPLNQLVRDIKHRKPVHLEPIENAAAPIEVQPMIAALNQLFERLQHAFENERRFTSDAAHELRTPLAALKTQAQLALKTTDNPHCQTAVDNIVKGVDRATHLLQQMLTLARIDPDSGIVNPQQIPLYPIIAAVIGELDPEATSKGIEVGLAGNEAVEVNGHQEGLTILARNLIHNAIHYTPQSGKVGVMLEVDAQHVTLQVDDNGPGVPEAEQARVFDRFYRPSGTPGTGSGLGLAIARRICELHHAQIQLSHSPLGGLRVTVRFPST